MGATHTHTPPAAGGETQATEGGGVDTGAPGLSPPAMFFVKKAELGQADRINTCIACNQACLDHVFENRRASCLVNPLAAYETELVMTPVQKAKRLAVVGAGPAGLSFACFAAERGHEVHLFDRSHEIGGQFNYAKQIPGKEEFHETIRYFGNRLKDAGVHVHLQSEQSIESLQSGFDEVILATGIVPRSVNLPGADSPKILSYLDVLRDHKEVGPRVAIIGAGGIGFDVAEYLTTPQSPTLNSAEWHGIWGIDTSYENRGALTQPLPDPSPRQVYLLQRKTTKVGGGLAKTSGWVHRATLQHKGVKMLNGVTYKAVTELGLEIERNGESELLEVDHIIVCAGQEPLRALQQPLENAGIPVHLIGGADVAAELDAKRAIRQGAELAAQI